jgi:hypothetical protein
MNNLTDHDKLTQIHAVLLGVNGNPGLCKLVDRNTRMINKLWVTVIILATSVGGGVYGIIELFKV